MYCQFLRTLILMLCWITSIMAQYALLLNVGSLAGDMFLNFAFTMLMELPAFVFIYTMADRLGETRTPNEEINSHISTVQSTQSCSHLSIYNNPPSMHYQAAARACPSCCWCWASTAS